VLKHCAANRKRRLSALPDVGPYIYDVKISGFTRSSIYCIYDIISLRVKLSVRAETFKSLNLPVNDISLEWSLLFQLNVFTV
jgi:hypothetical protein